MDQLPTCHRFMCGCLVQVFGLSSNKEPGRDLGRVIPICVTTNRGPIASTAYEVPEPLSPSKRFQGGDFQSYAVQQQLELLNSGALIRSAVLQLTVGRYQQQVVSVKVTSTSICEGGSPSSRYALTTPRGSANGARPASTLTMWRRSSESTAKSEACALTSCATPASGGCCAASATTCPALRLKSSRSAQIR